MPTQREDIGGERNGGRAKSAKRKNVFLRVYAADFLERDEMYGSEERGRRGRRGVTWKKKQDSTGTATLRNFKEPT